MYQDRRPKNVPIYIGATGMQMMELAGEIADGVVLNYLVDPAYNVAAMEALARGAAKAGRTVDDLDRPQLVDLQRRRGPSAGARRRPPDGDAVPRPAAAPDEGVRRARSSCSTRSARCSRGRPPTSRSLAASRLVPDEVVQRCTASGSPDEVVAKVDEYVANGCTCPILYPLGPDVGLMLDTFRRAA